jgi:hypothetical protein
MLMMAQERPAALAASGIVDVSPPDEKP